MSSAESPSATRKPLVAYRKIILGVIVAAIGLRLLWLAPATRQAVIWLLGAPKDIPLPVLKARNAITPETITNVHRLAHWGNGIFYSMAWSPDERYFAIGTTLGINLYEGKTFRLLRTIHLPLRVIEQLAFSPDGNLLAVTAAPGNILVIDLASDNILQQWQLEKPVLTLTYLNDGTLTCVMDLQSGGNERRLMKLENNQWQTVRTLDDGFLLDVAFVPEKQAFVVYYEKSVRFIDPMTGKETILPYTVPYGGNFILTHDVLLTVDRDKNLFSAYREGNLLERIELENLFNDPIASPDGRLLATVEPDPNGDVIRLWTIPALKSIRSIPVPDASPYVSTSIAFSPAGDHLALLVSPSVVKIFSTGEGRAREIVISDSFANFTDVAITSEGEIRSLSCPGTSVEVLRLPSEQLIDRWNFDKRIDSPRCSQLLGDGITVAIAPSYGKSWLYKVSEAESPVLIRDGCCSAFSSDGDVGVVSGVISSSGDPLTVSIWHKKFGLYQTSKFYNTEYSEFKVAVSPSGQYVAATSRGDTYLWIHGIETGRQYPALASQMTFSPDEKYLASASAILELATGRITFTELEEDLRYYPYFTAPAFSPDGQILVAEVDGTLRFWRVSDGTLLAKLDDPDFSDHKLIFSSDGTFLVGLGEGFVNIWGISEIVRFSDFNRSISGETCRANRRG